jgi:hypothetical protein
MTDSWWDLGETSGFEGNRLDVWRIDCAFCAEKGNFALAYHAEKKKANSTKKLNFDLYQCKNCMGYVHVLWSANEFGSGIYDYRVMPRPTGKPVPSENWPGSVPRYWTQAKDSLKNENWDAGSYGAKRPPNRASRQRGNSRETLRRD